MPLYHQPLFRFLFILISIIALLHLTALKLSFYSQLWWFDILMHFLGGFWVGITALWFTHQYILRRAPTPRSALFITLISITVVATLWEFFELWAGVPIVGDYKKDTALDLSTGVFGALAGYTYVMKAIVWKKN